MRPAIPSASGPLLPYTRLSSRFGCVCSIRSASSLRSNRAGCVAVWISLSAELKMRLMQQRYESVKLIDEMCK